MGLWRELAESPTKDKSIDQVEYEIRDPIHNLRLARIPCPQSLLPYQYSSPKAGEPEFYHPYYSAEDRQRRLTGIGPGDYQIALLIHGIRASNVVSIRIDPRYDYKSQPSVRLAKIEAPPASPHGTLAAWIVGPPRGNRLIYSDILGASIICDGVSFGSPNTVFAANPDFPPGDRTAFRLEVDKYPFNPNFASGLDPHQPKLPVSGRHTYILQAGKYPSAPFECDLSTTPLGDNWDRETATLPDAPAATPVLSGFVRDGQGHPLTQAEVLIYQERVTYIELVDNKGHYAFTHLPAGTYSTNACRLDIPQQSTSPYFPPIVVDSDQSSTRDFIFPNNSMN